MKFLSIMAGLFMGSYCFAETHTVTQKDKQFSKETLEIKVGDTIKFTNEDSTTHHLMFKDGEKKVSEKQEKDGNPFEHKFANEGDVTVRCAIHPKMKLSVKVKK